jgi:hypothetical protein
MSGVIMLTVITMSVNMLSVVTLNAVQANVEAPRLLLELSAPANFCHFFVKKRVDKLIDVGEGD